MELRHNFGDGAYLRTGLEEEATPALLGQSTDSTEE